MNKLCREELEKTEGVCSLLKEIDELYGKLSTEAETVLPYRLFKQFRRTGNRANFEEPYFDRRRRLALYAVKYIIDGNEKDLEALMDLIWAICDEYTWCLPAHCANAADDEERVTTVDLFASETAANLGQIYYELEDKLDKEVKDRIKYEVRRRVIAPFIGRSFSWERVRTNWAAVCAGYVGIACIRLFGDEHEKIQPRINAAMESFLAGINDDGACQEGVSYWNYGFGVFCLYFDVLSEIQPECLEIFKREKVRNTAMFFQYACLENGIAVTFADCQPDARYGIPTLFFLKRIYGGDIKIPPYGYHIRMRKSGFPEILHSLKYFDSSKLEKDIANFEHYFPQTQMYVMKRDEYCFAAKGGHNDEPHNHNDVGSFLVVRNGRQVLCDIGVGTYDKDYFNPETRYGIFGNGAQGHSVPIINGVLQKEGAEYRAKNVELCGNTFKADIIGAYGMDGEAVRTFVTEKDEIKITDEFRFGKPTDITERFVSYEPPKVEDGRLVWDGVCMEFEPGLYETEVSTAQYRNNFKGVFTVWITDLKIKEPRESVAAEFIIKMI